MCAFMENRDLGNFIRTLLLSGTERDEVGICRRVASLEAKLWAFL